MGEKQKKRPQQQAEQRAESREEAAPCVPSWFFECSENTLDSGKDKERSTSGKAGQERGEREGGCAFWEPWRKRENASPPWLFIRETCSRTSSRRQRARQEEGEIAKSPGEDPPVARSPDGNKQIGETAPREKTYAYSSGCVNWSNHRAYRLQ